jgi:hypothetical protein
MLYIKTYDGIGWFVTGETGAVERPARFMSVKEALGWCVQHRPGAEVTIKRYDGSQELQDAEVLAEKKKPPTSQKDISKVRQKNA